jgi:hypothetical protein
VDWPSYGGDAQRTGWEKSDSRITKENVKDFQLVLKKKLDNQQTGPHSLSASVIIGMLISYRGFKELAFVAGSSGSLWSIDADLERLFWQKQLDSPANSACASGMPAMPALTPPVNFGAARARGVGAAARGPAAAPGRIGGTGFGTPRSVFVLTGDGKLRQLNSADGSDQYPPLSLLPANAKVSSLTIADGTIYTTSSGCGGGPNAVWAVDLSGADPKIASFALKSGGALGLGGFAIGADGTVYVQTEDALLALSAKELKLKQSFTAPGGPVTPLIFTWKGKEMVVSAGKNGSLYLLDAVSLGGDHKTALYETAPLSKAGVWGGLSSWEDTDGTRWVLAPVWGPLNPDLKSLLTNGNASNGSIVALRVEEQSGKPVLTPVWVSRDMSSPEPPVITSGVVFAVSAGPSHATLYALDGTTGKEMYSTGSQVTAPANLTGVTIANGRVYFTTKDDTLYAFGIFLER